VYQKDTRSDLKKGVLGHLIEYRKLKLLELAGLIKHVKTVINLTGNEEKYYRCIIREVKVSFKGNELSVSLEKEDYSDKFVRLWKRLASSNSEEIEHE